MRLTVDILQDFIDTINLSGAVVSFSDDGINTTIEVGKTYHVRPKMQIEIDSVNYEVLSVVNNQSIEVIGLVPTPASYTVPSPFYFHGTPILTDASLRGKNHADKVPMIYLYEILKERDLPIDQRVRRESDLRLFFLDDADFDNWETDDHYSKRLLGLNNLVDAFRDAVRADTKRFYLFETTFNRINHVNWGKFTDNRGHEIAIFDDDLTGVELSFTIPIKKCN